MVIIMDTYISSHSNFNMLQQDTMEERVLSIFAVYKSKLFINSVAVDLIPKGKM